MTDIEQNQYFNIEQNSHKHVLEAKKKDVRIKTEWMVMVKKYNKISLCRKVSLRLLRLLIALIYYWMNNARERKR